MDFSSVVDDIKSTLSSDVNHVEIHCPLLWAHLDASGNIIGDGIAQSLFGFPVVMGPPGKKAFSLTMRETL